MTRTLATLKNTSGSGVLIAALSGLSFALASFIIKMVPSVNSVQILVTRSLIQFLFYFPIVILYKLPIFGLRGERATLYTQGFLAFIAFGLMYISYRLIPLADASTIVFSSPVWTSIFAAVFLKEPCGLVQTLTIVIALIGVLLISKPSFLFGSEMMVPSINNSIINNSIINNSIIHNSITNNSIINNSLINNGSTINSSLIYNGSTISESLINSSLVSNGYEGGAIFTPTERLAGTLIALVSSILASIVFILLRRLTNTPSPVVISTLSLIAIICGIVYEVIINNLFNYSILSNGIGVPTTLSEYFWLLGNGLCGVFGQLCLTVCNSYTLLATILLELLLRSLHELMSRHSLSRVHS